MKKVAFFIMIISVALFIITSCSSELVYDEYAVSLADEPFVEEREFELKKGSDFLRLVFDMDQPGRIKLLVSDMTDYDVYPDEEPEFFVTFRDSEGNIIYENVSVSYGYTDNYIFEKGQIAAEITAVNKPRKLKDIAVSWVYAPESATSGSVETDRPTAAAADKNGIALFKLCVDEDGVYDIKVNEGCYYDGDYNFQIKNKNGENVTDKIFIHSNEWISRMVFLEKGEYTISVDSVFSVAVCQVSVVEKYEDVSVENDITLPATVGFNAIHNDEKRVTFDADNRDVINIRAIGSETYYDSFQTVDYRIVDSEGAVVNEGLIEESEQINISALDGRYTLILLSQGSCVVEIN